MTHLPTSHNVFLSGHPVKFNMSADKFLDNGNAFSGHECAEDGADSDSIKFMKNCEGQDNGCCQAAEVKRGFDHFVVLFQNLRKVPRENVGRNNGKHAVVGEADAETHQKKSGDKIQDVQWQEIWQGVNPGIVNVEHFSKSDSDYKGEQITGAKGMSQDHQCDNKQCLENIVPGSEGEHWESLIKDQRYRRDC